MLARDYCIRHLSLSLSLMNSELSSPPRTWSNHVQKRYWNTSREIEIGKYNNSREEEEKSINYDIHIKFIFARISIHISLRKYHVHAFPDSGKGKLRKLKRGEEMYAASCLAMAPRNLVQRNERAEEWMNRESNNAGRTAHSHGA